MENPFELIMLRLERIEAHLLEIKNEPAVIDGMEYRKVMSIHEVAKYLDISIGTIYKKTSTRQIPCIRKGKRLYFMKHDIDNWLMEGRQSTQKEIEIEAMNHLNMLRRKRK